jgi:hypothetical protein
MAATVTARLALDSSGFTAGLTKAQAALGKLGAIGVPVMAAGFAAAAAAAAGLAVGIKKAVDIGGALSELSARTGVAAGELRVLQMAFERAGMSADQVGPAVNRMQRAIVEASTGSKEAQQAFSNIGLSLDSIRSLSPDQQFEAIGQAIAGIKDPAAQAAATMQIFGRGAGNLLALFKDSGALGDAASAIGAQAELLTRNANLFDRASDILNTIGSKLEGFFVGVADAVVPAILPLLEAADGLDFAGLGQELGRQIAIGITALQDGSIGTIIGLSVQIALRRAANDFLKTMQGLAAGFPALFEGTIKNFALIASPEFWSGVKSAFLSAAITFGQKLSYLVADALAGLSEITGLRDMIAPALSAAISAGDSYAGQANELNASADAQLGSVASAITANMQEAYARFSDAFLNGVQNATETFDNGDLANALNNAIASVSATVDKNTAEARARFEASKTMIPGMDGEGGMQRGTNAGVIAQSLQQVGGGAAFARFSDAANPAAQQLREQQKANGFLARIEQKLTPQMALMPA